MKLGISQIAFKQFSLENALKQLHHSPIQGLELAATLLWDEPAKSSSDERLKIKNLISDYNIEIIGLQSLLFRQPHLKIFDSVVSRQSCLDHLKHMVELCRDLGGKLVSFGSPQNRQRGSLEMSKALEIAKSFFQSLASTAKDEGVVVCFEPIAKDYGCDFINTAEEGNHLVQLVGHPFFRLLLDTGNLAMTGEPCQEAFKRYADVLHHVQVNDPGLSPPGSRGSDHNEVAKLLSSIAYRGWVTIECFLDHPDSFQELDYAVNCYGQKDGGNTR